MNKTSYVDLTGSFTSLKFEAEVSCPNCYADYKISGFTNFKGEKVFQDTITCNCAKGTCKMSEEEAATIEKCLEDEYFIPSFLQEASLFEIRSFLDKKKPGKKYKKGDYYPIISKDIIYSFPSFTTFKIDLVKLKCTVITNFPTFQKTS